MPAPDTHLIAKSTEELANHITYLHFQHNPELLDRYGEAGKVRCYEDAVFHLNFLAESMNLNMPDMYANYILWTSAMLKSRNIPENDLNDNLNFVQQAVHEILGEEFSAETKEYIEIAKAKLKDNKEDNFSYITDNNPLKKQVTVYLEYLLKGKRSEATILINELIQKEVSVKDIYQFIFQVSQYEVGRLWQCNKITVAHEHYCTAATQQIMSGLYPRIFSTERKGKILVACSISGELHELGIRMVSDFFEMDGWDTYYLGANMPDKQLLDSLIEYEADVLALSVTLPTHISKVATFIKKVREHPGLVELKIMVGGYPFLTTPELWKHVAADAFAKNADQALTRANELING